MSSGIVRQIAIHLEDELIVSLQGPLERLTICPPKTILFLLMEHVHAWIFGGNFVRQLSRAVGRVAIHHQQFDFRGMAHEPLDNDREIILLVVSRDDDEGFLAHRVYMDATYLRDK